MLFSNRNLRYQQCLFHELLCEINLAVCVDVPLNTNHSSNQACQISVSRGCRMVNFLTERKLLFYRLDLMNLIHEKNFIDKITFRQTETLWPTESTFIRMHYNLLLSNMTLGVNVGMS